MRILLFFFLLSRAGAAVPETVGTVVATTSALACVAGEVGGRHLQVVTLVPAGTCPGHYDVSVSHLALLERGSLLLAHGYEGFLNSLLESVRNPVALRLFPEKTGWQVPDVQKSLYRRMAVVLGSAYPGHARAFEENASAAVKEIARYDRGIRHAMARSGLRNKSVVCNEHLKDVLEYLGLSVAGTYGRAEEFTPEQIRRLLKAGKERRVEIVIDNMQAGPDSGKALAAELGARHVLFSNFPSGFPGTETLRDTLKENVDRLLRASGTRP